MSERAKLIGECNKAHLPGYVEKLINSVKAELRDSLTEYDLVVVLLFGILAETGFTPLGVDGVLTGPESPYSNEYDSKKLSAIELMPKNWRTTNGASYSMKFHLNPYHSSVCQFYAGKVHTGTKDAFDDNLIVDLFVNNLTSTSAINIQPSNYVTSKKANIPNMFDKLDELSIEFKNAIYPIRNAILEENGMLNASLVGIPTEIKLKIFEYLKVPEDWKALSETCTDLHILGNDQKLWKKYLMRDYAAAPNHKASVEDLQNSQKEVDWKTEYLGRFIYDYCKRQGESGVSEQLWILSPTSSTFFEDLRYIVTQNFPAVVYRSQNQNVFDTSSELGSDFISTDDDDDYNVDDDDEDADQYDDEDPEGNSVAPTLEVLGTAIVGHRNGLTSINDGIGDSDVLREDEEDDDAASLVNNYGSGPDVYSVMVDVERNGEGDVEYDGSIMPIDHVFDGVSLGEGTQ